MVEAGPGMTIIATGPQWEQVRHRRVGRAMHRALRDDHRLVKLWRWGTPAFHTKPFPEPPDGPRGRREVTKYMKWVGKKL